MSFQRKGNIYNNKVDIYALGLIFFEMLQKFDTLQEKSKCWDNIRSQIFPDGFETAFPKEVGVKMITYE